MIRDALSCLPLSFVVKIDRQISGDILLKSGAGINKKKGRGRRRREATSSQNIPT
jgi:hypothetical protein